MRQQEMARWSRDRSEAEAGEGVRRYVDAVRDHWRVVVAIMLITVAAAAAYLSTAHNVYQTEADLIVTPAPADDSTALFTPGVIRASSNPVQGAETAASVALSSAVAHRARALLPPTPAARAAVASATAAPVGESDVVAITTQANDAGLARASANAIAQATIDERTALLHAQVDRAISVLKPQVAASKSASTTDAPGSLNDTLGKLQALKRSPDPTVAIESPAPVPSGAVSPRKSITLGAAALIGLVLGLGAALGMRSIDPHLRREEQLRALDGAGPVLARIPLRRHSRTSHTRLELEPYRALVASLAASLADRSGLRTVVVSGSSRGEGVSTTAMQLARAIASGGNRVILVVTDPTFPASAPNGRGLYSVLIGAASLGDALVPAAAADRNLRMLLASGDAHASEWEHEGISYAAARGLLDALKREADWVVIDAPPLTGMVNALPFAQAADAVVLVSRVAKTKLPEVAEVLEIVHRHELPLAGHALVGVRPVRQGDVRPSQPSADLQAVLNGAARTAG